MVGHGDAAAAPCDLDLLHRRLLADGQSPEALDQVFRYLASRRLAEAPADWLRWIEGVALRHPLRDVLHADPFTARAFARPRGYPADPTTFDYVYGNAIPELAHVHPAPGFREHPVHAYVTRRRPSSLAMAGRLRRFAREIDAAAERPGCRVLCLAAGHLREAALSRALQEGRIAELVAIDYDPDAVRTVAVEMEGLPVKALRASVRDLVGWRLVLGSFDLVCTGALFDHLPDRTARPLLEKLLDLLRPGGRLVVASFVPDHADQGYMECFMAWRMFPRGPAALHRLAGDLLDGPYAARTSRDELDTIAYLEVTRTRRSV